MSFNISKIAKNILDVVHGIPAARAREERAKACIKEIEAVDRYRDFLKKVGFSKKEIKAAIFYNKKIRKNLKEINHFANKDWGQFSLPPPTYKRSQKKMRNRTGGS